jgi:hypothetical protein
MALVTSPGAVDRPQRKHSEMSMAELFHFINGKRVAGRSGRFGDGPDSIGLCTCTKTITERWPSGAPAGAEFAIPAMS